MALSDLPFELPRPAVNGVAPSVVIEDGQLVINWPNPKPTEFMITSEAFEQLVTNINMNRKALAQAKKIFSDIGRLGQTLT